MSDNTVNATEGSQLPSEDEEEYVPLKQRRLQKLAALQEKMVEERKQNWAHLGVSLDSVVSAAQRASESSAAASVATAETSKSLVEQFRQLCSAKPQEQTEEEKLAAVAAEEQRLLDQVQREAEAPLQSVKERAAGVVYRERLTTLWRLPRRYREMSAEEKSKAWESLCIDVSGLECPPPLSSFREMRLPAKLLEELRSRGINRPSQIQMVGIPAALLGRDVVGIAFTGSGKTLAFAIPLVCMASEAERRLPLTAGEGPVGLCICPSRELAVQTTGTLEYLAKAMVSMLGISAYEHQQQQRLPHRRRRRVEAPRPLRVCCLMGGAPLGEQTATLQRGVHLAVATPGRLGDLLSRRKASLAQCRMLVLDEADRLLDVGFETEVRAVLDHMDHQRQTLLFSATMPRKVAVFAHTALVDPIRIDVGRAGAANLDVVQEIEYVKQEHRMPRLLRALQKTAPPVVVFCDGQEAVDAVQEYLLLKGVQASGIHGGMAQADRAEAISAFRRGDRDVLIGTDVAAKGLDIPNIRHVINFDMPREIENYVHRIGRTGRGGRTGLATAFVNKLCDETVLLDLRALLIEAGQRIPPFLHALGAGDDLHAKRINNVRGCAYCGGLGHRIANCPKLQLTRSRAAHANEMLQQGSRFHGGNQSAPDW